MVPQKAYIILILNHEKTKLFLAHKSWQGPTTLTLQKTLLKHETQQIINYHVSNINQIINAQSDKSDTFLMFHLSNPT